MSQIRPRIPASLQPHVEAMQTRPRDVARAIATMGTHERPNREGYRMFVVLPDVHRPFHDEVLWGKILQMIAVEQPEGLVLSGDYLDLYTLGAWNKGSVKKLKDFTLGYEYDDGRQGIDELEEVLPPDCEKHYLFGNHEDRFFRFVEDYDNAKLGGALRHPDEALRLSERGWKVYENWRDDYVQLGDHLQVMHGQYTNVHAAKKHLDSFKTSVLFGHTHRWQSYFDGRHAAVNMGFLGDKESDGFTYVNRATREMWVNGFMVVYVRDDGHYHLEEVHCYDGGFMACGRLY